MPFMNNKGSSTLGHTFRNFEQAIITIKVGKGENPESFSAHRELLRRCSGYFDRYFQSQGTSPYKNGDSSLELEDTHPDVFDAFMIWLYTGEIPHHLIEGRKEEPIVETNGTSEPIDQKVPIGDEDVDTVSWGITLDADDTVVGDQPNGDSTPSESGSGAEKVPGEGESEKSSVISLPTRSAVEKPELPKETLCPCCQRSYKWRSLEGFLQRRFISLYVFANKYEIPALRRAVTIAWQTNEEILQSMPDHSNVIAAYEDLPPSAPLCRYFLDMYSVYWNPDRDDERTMALRSQLPQPFLFELVTTLARGERPKMEQHWCEFHEHESDADRKACQEQLMKDPVASKALKRIQDSKSWKGLVFKKGKR
ncbi:hypothetical protein BCR34DRAFT_480727 [Clohesyomyces aquaticus]|uniref:BTB domain-containing protein n=1 Tax=Clohesyomyces aquaticus TaxID=1231657 RepID=A0A1Y1ZTS2_9PLEO|nr:hypothetical protein BCR34DRAFT_480727 [Clohesyomyces aquaticus]